MTEVRARHGAEAAEQKLARLRACAGRRLASPALLRRYHDTLLFLDAYPDDPVLRALVRAELGRVAVAAAAACARPGSRRALATSGIAGTTLECAYSVEMVRWLVGRFPGALDLVWEYHARDRSLAELARACAAPVEADGVLKSGLSTRAWLARAAGSGSASLGWLVAHLPRLGASGYALERVVDSLGLFVRWRLEDPLASTTSMRVPLGRPFYHRHPAPAPGSVEARLDRPLPPPAGLAPGHRRALADVVRTSLLVRHRETDPVTYLDEGSLELFPLERGFAVALFGMVPARRLALDTYVGYLALKNGVPVGYGGTWILFDRGEIGINVFDAFRGGESALLLALLMRAYRQRWGVARFVVDPFQFGRRNAEGIRSGAFWFYYRLGFRPVDGGLRRLAAAEWARLGRRSGARTPPAVLRRLACSPLELRMRDAVNGVPALPALALAVTDAVARAFGGSRDAAEAWALRRLRHVLPTGRLGAWTAPEREALRRLALPVALIPDLERWAPAERAALVALVRAKGASDEHDYARRLREHRRLRAALDALCQGPGAPGAGAGAGGPP